MPNPAAAIRGKRKLTNRLIAAHDAARLRLHLTDDMLLIAGHGAAIHGADAVVAAFAGQFADPAFCRLSAHHKSGRKPYRSPPPSTP